MGVVRTHTHTNVTFFCFKLIPGRWKKVEV